MPSTETETDKLTEDLSIINEDLQIFERVRKWHAMDEDTQRHITAILLGQRNVLDVLWELTMREINDSGEQPVPATDVLELIQVIKEWIVEVDECVVEDALLTMHGLLRVADARDLAEWNESYHFADTLICKVKKIMENPPAYLRDWEEEDAGQRPHG